MTGPATSARGETRGVFFEEFEPGQVFRSGGRTVTEADIAAFAGLSGDFNPLHVDEVYAQATPFRGRIAHGLLIQSVASGLAYQTGIFSGTIAALKEMDIRFRAPVHPGDTVAIELAVTEKESDPAPRRGWVRFGATVRNQRQEVIIEGAWLTLIQRRAARSGAAQRASD